jgi:hypothetical protein
MALKIPGIPNLLFEQSRIEDVGIGKKGFAETQFWSCNGCNFVPNDPNGNTYSYNAANGILTVTVAAGGDDSHLAPVSLPHGSVVTGAVVFGNDATNVWVLSRRAHIGGAVSDLAAATNVNTENTTISNAIIDNNAYSYFFATSFGANDTVEGARITYQF